MRALLCLALLWTSATAQEQPEEAPEVGAVLADALAELPAPEAPELSSGVTMAVSARSEAAAESVRHGMTCLHAGWDFQAYRHFAAALEEDPECLMAHWGVVMALFHGSQDLADAREAAARRMLDLLDAGAGTEHERRYVFGLMELMGEGPEAAANAFGKAAEKFPNDPQLGLLHALLGRGGFDMTGDATPDQERSEEILRGLIERFPDLHYLRYALLAMRAEASDLSADLEMARELAEDAPGFPPYHHLLGHYEWRSGNHGRAHLAFGRAVDLYADWMERADLTPLRCAPWTRSEAYRAVALASQGKYDTALAVAEGLANIEVPPKQADTNGGRMLLWEGRTLPARILLKRGAEGDMKQAVQSLPNPDTVKGLNESTMAVWSFQAHSTIAGARLALAEGEMDAARKLSEDLTRLGHNFVKTRGTATELGERSPWLRAFKAFEVMASELRGLLTMAGPEGSRGTAYNWFRSAADRQERATLMMPPAVLLPMEVRLAQYYKDADETEKAVETLTEGLEDWPDDYEILTALKPLYETQGMDEEAAEVAERLEGMSGE